MLPSAQTGSVAPGVAWLRVSETTELFRGMKAEHGITITCAGRSLSRIDGRERVHTPGTLGLMQPGQVHCNVRRDTPGSFQLVSFDAWRIDEARSALDQKGSGLLESDAVDPRDERARPLRRLHEMVLSHSPDRFALDVAITLCQEEMSREPGAVRAGRRSADTRARRGQR